MNPKNPAATVCDSAAKTMDEYIEMGIRLQDEMFKMAQHQMNSFREYNEFAMKNQAEFFCQFEKNAKATRELWMEGLKKWRAAVDQATTPKQ